jgi:hypothetical protein
MSVQVKPGTASLFAAGLRLVFILAAALSVALCLDAGIAQAHGGGPGLTYDPCMRQTGADDFIHFAAYQPEFNPFAEYCDALPKAGRALLVFDLIGAELPEAAVSLEVLDEGGRLQVAVPARRYHSGVANLQTNLPPGKYAVVIKIGEPGDNHRIAFPLTVGAWWDKLLVPAAIVLVIIIATLAYCAIQVKVIPSSKPS